MPDDRAHDALETDGAVTIPVGPFTVRGPAAGPIGAPLVLLLHGVYAGASSYEWREIVPLLAREHRVWAPDLLGAGASDRPDLDWTADRLTETVGALVRAAVDADERVVVVGSSLTGAHAVRASAGVLDPGRLVLITPTGMGRALTRPAGRASAVLYGLARHTPLGDGLVAALSSGPSVRWFQQHQTYADPSVLTEDEVRTTRRVARLTNAKHLQLAFVTNRLGLALDPCEVAALRPRVLWGSGQGFADPADPDRWRAAGADVTVVADGLPQVESPEATAALIAG
jgi:pimeloyl-ACP methyl ester carboxylesterase